VHPRASHFESLRPVGLEDRIGQLAILLAVAGRDAYITSRSGIRSSVSEISAPP
jgi:hypothetical protein